MNGLTEDQVQHYTHTHCNHTLTEQIITLAAVKSGVNIESYSLTGLLDLYLFLKL